MHFTSLYVFNCDRKITATVDSHLYRASRTYGRHYEYCTPFRAIRSEILFKDWFVAVAMANSKAENHCSNFLQNTLVVCRFNFTWVCVKFKICRSIRMYLFMIFFIREMSRFCAVFFSEGPARIS